MLLLIVSLVTAAYLLYSGLLAKVTISTTGPPIKNFTFAYKFRKQPYRKRGKLFRESSKIGPKLPCIAIYYDDPAEVPESQCHYAVGSILSEGENEPDKDLLKSYQTSGFNIFSFPEVTDAVTTSFPYRTFFSVLLPLMRVYPKLRKHIKILKEDNQTAYPIIEIYREDQIHFMLPMNRMGDFYVPEIDKLRMPSKQEESHSDTDISGADSNSEHSSGSGVLPLDSRESSPAASPDHSAPIQDQGDTYRRRYSRGTSFRE